MGVDLEKSMEAFGEAVKVIPGGVNSPVRAFQAVGGSPLFIKKAKGAYIYDEDDNSYIDYIGSWGPMILGHTHPEVVTAVKLAVENGFSYGAPTCLETRLVEKVISLVPSIQKARLVSSGTEACMSALRLARGFTGRDKILKFVGCYHGHGDMLLVQAGSGVATLGIPGCPGVPKGATADTLTVPYNDLAAVHAVMEQYGDQLAAIIVEPFVGNAGFIRPQEGFLEGLREVCDKSGAILIFDEVMTGFRIALGGAQSFLGVRPDLTTLGKVIGGGMPMGAFGGREDIMNHIAPMGPVYQAGTLSGNPVAVSCGLKTLEILEEMDFSSLSKRVSDLVSGLKSAADRFGVPLSVDCQGGMFGFAFKDTMPSNFEAIEAADMQMFKQFFHRMLLEGIYLAPSGYEAGFVSFSHSETDILATVKAAERSIEVLAG